MTSHARQCSKEGRIYYVFHRAIVMSDPKLSLMFIDRRIDHRVERPLPDSVLGLMKNP